MKIFKVFIVSVVLIVSLISCATTPPSVTQGWSTPEGLMVPESVLYDGVHTVYVANINGGPTELNGAGFISKITTEGEIIELKWITGLDAPKGMGIYENKLYVTDVNKIHVIDISQSTIINTIPVEGAEFLNDIAIDSMGYVYFTDLTLAQVNVLKGDIVEVWSNLEGYSRSNGLFMEQSDLLVGTAEGIVRIGLDDKMEVLDIPHAGGIDGLKACEADGSYIVSDWAGKVQIISNSAEPIILSDTSAEKINAADFEFISDMGLILVPTFFDNRVVAYKLMN